MCGDSTWQASWILQAMPASKTAVTVPALHVSVATGISTIYSEPDAAFGF
jgi:hypothetical protein